MKVADSPPWTGIVLAGGQSSRMGQDKAGLPWGSHTLLEQARSQLLQAGATRVVICGRSGTEDAVPDAEAGQGPLAALAQLAPQLEDGIVVIVPVDMPLLSPELLQQLAAADSECAAFDLHPLPMRLQLAANARQVLAQLSQRPASQRSLRALQQELQALTLDGAVWQTQLRGCNTQEEWLALSSHADCPASDQSK